MCLGNIEIGFIDRMLTISSHNLKWFSPTRNNKSSIIVCSTYSFWMCIIYLVFPIMLNKKQSFIYLCVIFRNRRKESDYFITLSVVLIYYHGIICIMAQSVLQFVCHTCKFIKCCITIFHKQCAVGSILALRRQITRCLI